MKQLFIYFLSFISILNLNAQQNTILIIADDVGTDYFGFYEDHVDTAGLPNIRRILQKGVRFKNAMSNPVCSPTRAGILTGRYSFRTGVGDVIAGSGSGVLDTTEKVIPRLLKTYKPAIKTANIGKWHLHLTTPATNLQIPNLIGYDHYAGNFLGAITSYTNWTKVTNGVSGTSTNYATTETANDAISWIKAQNNNQFFLWLGFNAPHTPLHLPPLSLHSYTTLSGTTTDINNNPKLYFKAALEALDHEIGRLLDSLVAFNKMDSTNIIFIGDNGNAIKYAQIANTTRAKGTIYQYGTHVPFIISGPAVINPKRVSSELVNTVDIFSTVLELFGFTNWSSLIPINRPVDSKSILPIIKDQAGPVRPWAFTEIFKLVHDSTEGKTMRNTDYKLLDFDDGRQEFYNLTLDPNELNDLLLSALTSTDISNYNYLCNEMFTLVGAGTFCTPNVGIKENNNSEYSLLAYPNPFTSQIKILQKSNDYFILLNAMGNIVYEGTQPEMQELSNLPKGIYYLRVKSNDSTHSIKLIKE